jgi:hypothetical protein
MEYMSSWANRHLPRKRNVEQIPIEFRPTIIPRVAQPQVVESEKFQVQIEDSKNEVIYPSEPSKPAYLSRRIEPVVASAIELHHEDQSYVFVILRHIRNARDNDLWISSYNSIRKFYTNKVIIIDDNSSVNTVNGRLVNTDVIYSDFNGAGEILPYYYFLKNKWADRMIFMHDSMFLQRRFRPSELEQAVSFHWHFNQEEGKNDRKITNYLSLLQQSEELMAYLDQPTWRGCFGATTIITYDVVQLLEEKYGIFSKLPLNIRTRIDRQTFERILGLVLFYEGLVDDNNCSNFGNIMKYPGAFESMVSTAEQVNYTLTTKGYDTAIGKLWRGR